MPDTDVLSPPVVQRAVPPVPAPTTPFHSEAIEEIIEHVPHAIIRWGITGWCAVLLLVLGVSYFVKYPDLISAPVMLEAYNGPKPVVARMSGTLQQVLVREGQPVQAQAALAYLESQADPTAVLAMAAWADTLSRQLASGQAYSPAQQQQFRGLNQRALGEVQEAFQAFNAVHYQFLALREHGFYSRRKALLAAELHYLQVQHTSLLEQQHLHQQGLALAQAEFSAQRRLFEQGVTSQVEYRQESGKLLRQRLVPRQAQDAVNQNLALQISKRQELMTLEQTATEQQNAFWSALNAFRSALAAWQHAHVLRAPVAGVVHYSSLLQANQLAKAETPVFYVTPQPSAPYASVAIAQASFGKVRVGQQVNLKFAGYPFQQYGLVRGRVRFIAALPSADGTFQALVALPNGLATTHGHVLRPQVGMQGQAEIITDDLRLFERFTHFLGGGVLASN